MTSGIDGSKSDVLNGRFASIEEACSPPFERLGRELAAINSQHGLTDHTELNRAHYPWAEGRFPGTQLYGSRLWEYPFAILASDPQPGMTCADVGCGRTPFTVYLASQPGLKVTGFDPDLFAGPVRDSAFGMNEEFIRSTGLEFCNSGMERLDAPDNHFDRVFCLSVIEHLDADTARKGIREMARVLKPGGRLILTVDVAIHETYCDVDPLSLLWESGLLLAGKLDLKWPTQRLGIGYHGDTPADVFGLVLEKSDYPVETRYAGAGVSDISTMSGVTIPGIRVPKRTDPEPISWPQRFRKAWHFFIQGNRPKADGARK